MSLICYAKLKLEVNLLQIQQETRDMIESRSWLPHFNTFDYEGQWNVLPLRSPGGTENNGFAELMGNSAEFKDTPLLNSLTATSHLLDQLKCRKKSARLLNLKAGSSIKKHRDVELAYEHGEVRLHFPIFSNNAVKFYIDDDLIRMMPGECWYINANRPHRAENRGGEDRIHLVVDCIVNDWVASLLEKAEKKVIHEKKDRQQQMMIIESLRMQNTATSLELARQLELELNDE